MYSEHDINKNIVDCLPFDFDDHENPKLNKSYKEAHEFYSYLKEVYDYEPRLYFSGRGFHLYIDFKPVELEHFKATAVKLYTSIKRMLQFDTMDFTIVGDKRRVMRIPYTMNINSKMYCFPIDYSWDISAILSKSCHPDYSIKQEFINAPFIRKILIDYERDEIRRREATPPKPVAELDFKGRKDRIKLETDMILKYSPTTEDHRHRILHFMLVPRLILIGKTDDEIRNICKDYINTTWGGKSYSEYSQYVEDSIKRTKAGRWMPWSWDTFFTNFPDAAKWFKKE